MRQPSQIELSQQVCFALDGDRAESRALWREVHRDIEASCIADDEIKKLIHHVAIRIFEEVENNIRRGRRPVSDDNKSKVDTRRRTEQLVKATGLSGRVHSKKYQEALRMWKRLAQLPFTKRETQLWLIAVAERVVKAERIEDTAARRKAIVEALGLEGPGDKLRRLRDYLDLWREFGQITTDANGEDTIEPAKRAELVHHLQKLLQDQDELQRVFGKHPLPEIKAWVEESRCMTARQLGNRIDKLFKPRRKT